MRQQQLKQQQIEQARQQEVLRLQQLEQQKAEQALQQEVIRQQQAQAEASKQQQLQQQAALQAQQRAATEQSVQMQQQQQQHQQFQSKQNASVDMLSSGLAGLGLVSGLDSRSVDSSSLQLGQSSGGSVNSGHAIKTEVSTSSYLGALNESLSVAPGTGEKDRSRQYAPQNPYPTPASYPATPSTLFENPGVFEKLGTDCLFFIFYYAQGTYQQYLAARELKKQSWRFHKKYMTWFQRHEEPMITTDEYEQGTYVYFDYETGWCTRIKQDFRFEYSFLEDTLQ